MKKIFLILSLFISLSIALMAQAFNVEFFVAKSEGTYIAIEWKATSEDDVLKYEIERSKKDEQFWKKIASYDSKGQGYTYTYKDEDVLFKEETKNINDSQQKNTFTYRLKIHKKSGNIVYSDIAYVTHSVNSVKRTWGMLKEMFR